MAKVTGTKKESSSKSNLKDLLNKIKKFTPIGMTVEVAKKAAETLKKDSNTIKDKLEEPAKKEDKFKRRFPKVDRMPLPKNERPKFERLPLNPNEQKTGVQYLSRGGRAGYKSGTRGCKLAMKGKGRAYGKNS